MAGLRDALLATLAADALMGFGDSRIRIVLRDEFRPARPTVSTLPQDTPNELGYTPRQMAEDEDRSRAAESKRERRRQRNLRILTSTSKDQ